ncbi:lysophospholipid acyltransferase family protein [Cronobacter muytjensii]|uniref:lysophospholipid acyltransferase family protein n=1 Tax=Cronobacter muytjensii TaxID=413501 RepID=UPI0034D5549C
MSHFFSPDKTLVRAVLVTFCRLLTGVRAFWHQPPDQTRPAIYYANHSSHLDGLVIWASLPKALRDRAHPVAAADYWQKTWLRRYLASRIFNVVLLERNRPPVEAESARDPLDTLVLTLEKGDSLIFFPEGTRGDGEALAAFKSGLYHLARRTPQAQLVPVWLENMNRVLPKGSHLVVPVICTATFGLPEPTPVDDETKAAFLARTKTALEALAND